MCKTREEDEAFDTMSLHRIVAAVFQSIKEAYNDAQLHRFFPIFEFQYHSMDMDAQGYFLLISHWNVNPICDSAETGIFLDSKR